MMGGRREGETGKERRDESKEESERNEKIPGDLCFFQMSAAFDVLAACFCFNTH